MPIRTPPWRIRRVAVLYLVALIALGGSIASCSSSDADPEATGATQQAVERLTDFGLNKDEATCVVDELGAASVVEATELNAFVDGQSYQDAAAGCTEDA